MPREMLINMAESEECRIAVVEDGSLEELYVERASLSSRVGNIYKGKIVNIESGIQAAFIDFGTKRNGFLHISDLHPKYFSGAGSKHTESVGRRKALKERMPGKR
jgi:ribonuclease E